MRTGKGAIYVQQDFVDCTLIPTLFYFPEPNIFSLKMQIVTVRESALK